MLSTYTYPKFEYVCPPEVAEQRSGHYPVVIVGAGPVGLSMAIDLAAQGQQVLLLDNDEPLRRPASRSGCVMSPTTSPGKA